MVCPWGKESDCTTSAVVYLISCQACGQKYIGETGRPLLVRSKKHLGGNKKLEAFTVLGCHKVNCHGEEDFGVEMSILGQILVQTSARKALEAFRIYIRYPKEECLHITREFKPFISLAL